MPLVNLSQKILDNAKQHSKISHRSTSMQIEYWAHIGKIAEENPDLPYSFLSDISLGLEETKAGSTTEYTFN